MMDKSLDELKSAFNVLLNIPNIEVDEVELDREGNYRVTIHSTERGTCCHQCGNVIVLLIENYTFGRLVNHNFMIYND